MTLPFRRRIFVVLVAMTAIPVTLAFVGWLLSLGAFVPAAGARASLEAVGRTAVDLRAQLDTGRLTPPERAALESHLAEVSRSLSLARRAEAYTRYYKAGIAAAVALIAAAVLFAAVPTTSMSGSRPSPICRPSRVT